MKSFNLMLGYLNSHSSACEVWLFGCYSLKSKISRDLVI